MSRIGMKPVPVPAGVKVTVNGNEVVTEGKLGKMSVTLAEGISAVVEGDEVKVSRVSDEGNNKAMHGLFRSLIKNNIIGVSEGYKKELLIVGVGYKAVLAGSKLTLSLGYSHDIVYEIPEGIKVVVTDATKLTITGTDKQLVGEVAASIRKFKKPEPYKGKGIRYVDERIVLKEGTDVTIFATGLEVAEAIEATKMLEADGISVELVNIHTIKPIDKELVVASATKTGKVVTVEEHFITGGLGSAVCEVLSEKAPTKVLRIGVEDCFGESGPALELIKKYGLDAEGIYKKVKAFVK